MTIEVIGVGLGRTGTASLKLAIEQLGFGPCHHMLEVLQTEGAAARWSARARGEPIAWEDLLGGFRATLDWPSVYFWRELVEHYPNARVILTERDEESWFASISSTIFRALAAPLPREPGPVRDQRAMALDIIVERHFDNRAQDRAHVLDVYRRHNAAVRAQVSPDRLLVHDVSAGWAPLCRFLGVPVPAAPFPHANRGEEFRQGVGRDVT